MSARTASPKCSLTKAVEFDPIPRNDTHLCSVNAGVDADDALREAECLYESVSHLLSRAIHDEGLIDSHVAWLCRFAMEAADALREAAGAKG